MLKKPRVCIIGCGPSGMSALYHFSRLPKDVIPDITCYEKQTTWGGQWNPTWRTGFDEYGELVHSTIYPNMITNVPKEVMEYSDYTLQQHFKKPIPSFVDAKTVKDYLEGRMTHGAQMDLKHFVKFSTVVRMVEYDKPSERFTITLHNLDADKVYDEGDFTHVIVAVGLFSIPYCPSPSGIEQFTGRVLHARDFREATEFKGKNILILGSSLSAQDIALLTHRNGANRVVCSWKESPMGFKWPIGIEERPEVNRFEMNTVHFIDGSSVNVDVVIFCTGYQKHFPFLPDDLRLKEKLSFHVDHLYKGILWLKGGDKRLLYLGMQNQLFTFPMFDAQALWACTYIIDRLQIPSLTEMMRDIDYWRKKHDETVKGVHTAIDYQTDYISDVSHDVSNADNPNRITEIGAFFHQLMDSKDENINAFKQKLYTSVYSGV